jgi:hypothetical protein
MLDVFCLQAQIFNGPGIYTLFSLAKLMSSMVYSGDDVDDVSTCSSPLFEVVIGGAISQYISPETVHRMQQVGSSYRRRLCKIVWRLYNESLLFDDNRISLTTKARRYVELVCLFLDKAMLTEVFSLRITCKANNGIRKFPIYYSAYRELEANVIEGFIAYDASRFVSTTAINTLIGFHCIRLSE